MKKVLVSCAGILIGISVCHGDSVATVAYSYDAQNRLTQASYGSAQKVFYGYDGANNLDIYTVITDSQYLESFLLQFSMLEPFCPLLPEILDTWRELVALAAQKG